MKLDNNIDSGLGLEKYIVRGKLFLICLYVTDLIYLEPYVSVHACGTEINVLNLTLNF